MFKSYVIVILGITALILLYNKITWRKKLPNSHDILPPNLPGEIGPDNSEISQALSRDIDSLIDKNYQSVADLREQIIKGYLKPSQLVKSSRIV